MPAVARKDSGSNPLRGFIRSIKSIFDGAMGVRAAASCAAVMVYLVAGPVRWALGLRTESAIRTVLDISNCGASRNAAFLQDPKERGNSVNGAARAEAKIIRIAFLPPLQRVSGIASR